MTGRTSAALTTASPRVSAPRLGAPCGRGALAPAAPHHPRSPAHVHLDHARPRHHHRDRPPDWGPSTELLPHEADNLATIATVAPLWSTRDIPSLLEHYADDIVWRNVAMGEVYDGKEAVKAFLERLFVALPDISSRSPCACRAGKYVAEEYVLRGTHLGPMFGLPPTGRPVELKVMSLLELRDGKMKEDHFYFDVAIGDAPDGLLPGVVRGLEAARPGRARTGQPRDPPPVPLTRNARRRRPGGSGPRPR